MKDKKMTTYWITCKFCGGKHVLSARPLDVQKWLDGAYIQDALPYLTPDERELMISGMCPTCWTKTFGSDEG